MSAEFSSSFFSHDEKILIEGKNRRERERESICISFLVLVILLEKTLFFLKQSIEGGSSFIIIEAILTTFMVTKIPIAWIKRDFFFLFN
jgi:hypothetical protein